MDSLRTEEVKRQKTAILKQFGLSEKTDPKTVSVKIKRKLQVRVFIKKIFADSQSQWNLLGGGTFGIPPSLRNLGDDRIGQKEKIYYS
jgi:hypothetical protein